MTFLVAPAAEGAMSDERIPSFLGSGAAEVLVRLTSKPPLVTASGGGVRRARPVEEITAAEVPARWHAPYPQATLGTEFPPSPPPASVLLPARRAASQAEVADYRVAVYSEKIPSST